ncbi:unnamed protein product [Caenorhabditis sp. 36 PRJEB53466]|nr:unnamed protein product [Caenorhabditis sp. 36 PRJEB53466]
MNRKSFGGKKFIGRHHKIDAKQLPRKKSRFARLDPDIQSRYDGFDDEPSVPARSGVPSSCSRCVIVNPSRHASVARTAVADAEIAHKISVIACATIFDKKWLTEQLNQRIENFKPLLWSVTRCNDIEFYVRDEDSAAAIKANSRRIVHQESGHKVIFLVHSIPAPWMRLKRREVDIINKVVDKRFDEESRVLDLSNFHDDNEFTSRNMVMQITKGNVMLAVLDRIDDKYGNAVALSLANNRLRHLDFSAALVPIAKFVKELDLSNNLISFEREIDKLSGLPVERLFLEGNAICETFTQKDAYLRCNLLDGVEVQPLVTEPDTKNKNLIPFKAGHYPNDEIRLLIDKFVAGYFEIYDGPHGQKTRRSLRDLYDTDASQFTLTISNLVGLKHQRYHSDKIYYQYLQMSHNLLTHKFSSRSSEARVARGSREIAVALSKLPTSKHFMDTLLVDVFLFTSEILGFTVQGLFQDGELDESVVQQSSCFTRTFIVTPRAEGAVTVLSDQLFISSASSERIISYKKLLHQAITHGSETELVDAVQAVQIGMDRLGFDGAPPAEVREQMVKAFREFTNMNVQYATKCLSDFEWNYEASAA